VGKPQPQENEDPEKEKKAPLPKRNGTDGVCKRGGGRVWGGKKNRPSSFLHH